ncbi:hypothetical protein EDB86DRAFT_2834207 [Lactarius hatsudake]|nr:hypothetical protein EDB86DRAFT_2834207 [Lactarius hatsudake]
MWEGRRDEGEEYGEGGYGEGGCGEGDMGGGEYGKGGYREGEGNMRRGEYGDGKGGRGRWNTGMGEGNMGRGDMGMETWGGEYGDEGGEYGDGEGEGGGEYGDEGNMEMGEGNMGKRDLGVRVPWALGPKLSIFGLFGLRLASCGLLAISVSLSHGIAPAHSTQISLIPISSLSPHPSISHSCFPRRSFVPSLATTQMDDDNANDPQDGL